MQRKIGEEKFLKNQLCVADKVSCILHVAHLYRVNQNVNAIYINMKNLYC